MAGKGRANRPNGFVRLGRASHLDAWSETACSRILYIEIISNDVTIGGKCHHEQSGQKQNFPAGEVIPEIVNAFPQGVIGHTPAVFIIFCEAKVSARERFWTGTISKFADSQNIPRFRARSTARRSLGCRCVSTRSRLVRVVRNH